LAEIRRSYHDQLDELRDDVVRLGGSATEAIVGGTEALLGSDLVAADRIISSDAVIDALTHSIEERSFVLLARQQPVASDLRTIVTVMRMIHEIERTGDLMVNVAKAARRLYPAPLPPQIRGIIDRMGLQASTQLRMAVKAFSEEDASGAPALDDMDDIMDELQRELFRAIFSATGYDDETLHWSVQLGLVGRYYERIADHGVNIGQRVAYMVTGRLPTTEAEPPSPADGPVGDDVALA
jgi:phosphate transport system protein